MPKRQRLENKKMSIEERFDENFHSDVTLEHAWLNFMIVQKEKGNSKPTMDYYERYYKKLAKITENGSWNCGCLTMEGFQLVFIKSLGEVSQQTINSYLRAHRAFGKFCEDNDFIKGFRCPIKEIEPPPKEVYTDAEVAKLLKKPKLEEDFVKNRCYIAIVLMLSTGARCNSLLNLKIKDVDLDGGYVTYNTTKTGKIAHIGLPRKAVKDLREYIRFWRYAKGATAEDYLLCNDYGDGPLSREAMWQTIKRYNEKKGVHKSSLHLFRHTFAKNWIVKGGDIISLAKVLTHSELEMVKRYSNLYATDTKEKVEEFSVFSNQKQQSGKTLKNK